MDSTSVHDIFVIGGGINGCGIARDAAGRGYSVILAEMNDLASGTSSAATKLIHGGLRYLEHYEFRLVHEALAEREVLWASAPHIIWPLRLVLPYHKGLRPAWLLRLGLFIYDHLGGRKLLPPTRTLDMRTDPAGKPLQPLYAKAFEYSDCWVNDARMVVLAARDAADRGATIRTRTAVVSAQRQDGQWAITTRDNMTGATDLVHARLLINAAGPWVDTVLSQTLGQNSAGNVRLVQGSHIVVNKLYEHDRCYMFQNADGRIIFAIPYETDFTLIGTTDQDYQGDPRDVRISDGEIDYLTQAASEYFVRPVTRDDIVWSYSGVRPLYDDGAGKAQEATRDYVLKTAGGSGESPLINVIGGKLTTFRRLAETTLLKVEALIGAKGAAWTRNARLPGGDFPPTGFPQAVAALKRDYPFLDLAYATRLVRLYGTRAATLLGAARSPAELGQHFGADLYEAEVRYLVEHEWAMTSQDILWRRTKRGLLGDAIRVADLDQFLTALGAPFGREQTLA
ncbi:glycerol-3-phosphate dehydrogenase [Devosia psychrophila]|uniref:Glycerol-3-phosphate dehydrogenase n=1 Tax=Devosia psychrophila TaxID=728005 RepID=A0A0F5PTU5_9HYPH|nr:glycerol-3-phosphate dehydrogenase [Devosia psychrophila]KKC31821.1 glycerol-3-phosphate dehydrogenase [Devosia psychrophila]SFC78098.1 glycerol-3-phosphate dehydrogenase [Devosia psychrophila]